MGDFSKWPIQTATVNRLRLDPENPRLATSVKRPTQQELIADLLEHEDVIGLVRDIARQGFFPNDLLVAIRDDSKTIVVEGNRRLAALKLLLNPELAPPSYQKRIRQYAAQSRTTIEKIQIVLAPNRNAAVPIIIARHKGEAVKAWTTVMQARFVQGRIDEGLSIDDVAEETGLERAEVVRQLRDAKLYDVIRSLPLPAAVEQTVSDPRQFPFTTLRRLIEYSSVQDLLGIETDERKGFVTSLPADRFQSFLARIVTDIATEVVTSRSHNTSAQVEQYIKEIEHGLGKARKTPDKKTPADEFVDPSRLQPQRVRRPKKAVRKHLPPSGLIPKGFRVDIEDARIRDIAEELKAIKIVQFPNAVAITFRSLLDMAVTKYLQDSGDLKAIKARLSSKQPKSADWVPTLKQQLDYILQTNTIPLAPEGRKALQKFISDTRQSLTLDSLNWFTHNRYVPPTVEQMRAFWTMLTPLLELTLQSVQ